MRGCTLALTIALVLLTYALTDLIGGNGFLAVYVAGIVMRRAEFIHKRSLIRFHDGIACDADRDVPDSGAAGVSFPVTGGRGVWICDRPFPDVHWPASRRFPDSRDEPHTLFESGH